MMLPYVEWAALILLILCWIQGDIPTRSKIIWTAVYVVTWVPLLFNALLHVSLQAAFGAALCWWMFGPSH
jgi:hypothetical protein